MTFSKIIAFLLCMFFIAKDCHSQGTVETCADISVKMNELKKLLDKVCDSLSPGPPVQQCNCPVTFNWTSVAATCFVSSTLRQASTISFTIPSVIPSSAKEVLIHAGVYFGTSNRGPYQNLKIFTQIGTARYEKYLMLYSWNQEAINTNSDNMWFPMPPNRRVYLTVPVANGAGAEARLYAIGYR